MSSVQKKIDSLGKNFNSIALFSREEIMTKNVKHEKEECCTVRNLIFLFRQPVIGCAVEQIAQCRT